jgi:hypothetical protein
VPADSTIIIASLGSALVTASVGAVALLRAHRQRLRHERELADRAELRKVLDSGSELLGHLSEVGTPAERQAMLELLIAYQGRLLLWVQPDDALSTGLVEVVQTLLGSGSAEERDRYLADGTRYFDDLMSSKSAWMDAARVRVAVSS